MKIKSQILHLNGVFVTTLLFLGLTSESVKAVSLTFSYLGVSVTIDFPGSGFSTSNTNDPRLDSLPFNIDFSSTLKDFNLTVDSKSRKIFESNIDQEIKIGDTFWQGNINIGIDTGVTDVLTNLSGTFRHKPGKFIMQPNGESIFINKENLPHSGDAASGDPFSINFGKFSGAETEKSLNIIDKHGVVEHPSIPHFDIYPTNKLTLTVDTDENEFSALNYVLVGKHRKNSETVPEPLTILGSATALGFGAFFKRKLKSSESLEKETTKVG